MDTPTATTITVAEAATILGCSQATVRRFDAAEHALHPTRTPGGQRRYDRAEVEALKLALRDAGDFGRHP